MGSGLSTTVTKLTTFKKPDAFKGLEEMKNEKRVEGEFRELLEELKVLIASLQLTENDVAQLHQCFSSIDTTSSTLIQVSSFLAYIGLNRSQFTNRVIYMCETTSYQLQHDIDFKTFLKMTWNYCTLNHAELVHCVYKLYDTEGNKELGVEEIAIMLEDLYGKHNINKPEAVAILNDIEGVINTIGPLNLADFMRFTQSHQKLLFPAFQMQHFMRLNVIGELFWERITIQRHEIFKTGKIMSQADFIALERNIGVDFYKDVRSDSRKDDEEEDPDSIGRFKHRHIHMSPLGNLAGTAARPVDKKSMSAMAARVSNNRGDALYVYNLKKVS
mmetsp:Transcript_23451/g.23649  ORF Transcript_23451/g.23649 Transcript_23451/m.23649 type:complete len:330 (+) Transcript_23451:144-1133(+)|eukprot:CAMPEP_0182434864 /NCGR_PEP_ID=MMETSP1167-20130531/72246_1 /TAXON_ID=2988 /ORGANISM="Mallomonas Sp, Strain CCMP3275" /LENGTH=329 /DNA_ID=CAMNT_0024625215 /DNA_START=81 /DNA_END=1070 /DNA_ORIENTATION=-